MSRKAPDFEHLFDADAYFAAGGMPWSFSGYEQPFADASGRPADPEMLEFLATLQSRGIAFGIWVPPDSAVPHWWLVVAKDAIQNTIKTLQAMEADGTYAPGFLSSLSARVNPIQAGRAGTA